MERVYKREGILFKVLPCLLIAMYSVMCLFGNFVCAADIQTGLMYKDNVENTFILPDEYSKYQYIYIFSSMIGKYDYDKQSIVVIGSNSLLYQQSSYSNPLLVKTVDNSSVLFLETTERYSTLSEANHTYDIFSYTPVIYDFSKTDYLACSGVVYSYRQSAPILKSNKEGILADINMSKVENGQRGTDGDNNQTSSGGNTISGNTTGDNTNTSGNTSGDSSTDSDKESNTSIIESLKKLLNFFNPLSEDFILNKILDLMNPFSDNFFMKKLWEFLKDILSAIGNIAQAIGDVISPIFNPLWNFITNVLSWLNPLSDNFFLKKLFNWINPFSNDFFLAKLFSWINPLSDNFFGKKLIEMFQDLFEFIFVPSEERINAITNTVKAKFEFVDSVKTAVNSVKDILNNLGNAPKITLNLKATKYTEAQNTVVFDLSWYAPYKTYGDLVITGFVYLMFIWRLLVSLPGIISGVGNGKVYFDKIEDVTEKIRSPFFDDRD